MFSRCLFCFKERDLFTFLLREFSKKTDASVKSVQQILRYSETLIS